jgi:TorA-specific chaperone
MDPALQQSPEFQTALTAAIQRFCRIYWGPDPELGQQILDPSFLRPLRVLAPRLGHDITVPLSELDRLLERFSTPQALFSYLEAGYVRLFINDLGGIPAPLYASCYEDRETPRLMGAAALRMSSLLVELNLQMGDDLREPPDHLAVELEVLYYLLTRSSNTGLPDHPVQAADFAAREVLPWVRALNERLAPEVRCRFYSRATTLLVQVLAAIAGSRTS